MADLDADFARALSGGTGAPTTPEGTMPEAPAPQRADPALEQAFARAVNGPMRQDITQPMAARQPPAPVRRAPPGAAPRRPAAPVVDKPMAWGDVAHQAWTNLPGSALNLAKGVVNSVTDWRNTLGNFGELGAGLVSKAEGALGVKQDPRQKARQEATANAFIDPYKRRYGSIAGFQHSLAEDPIAPLMDLSTVLGGAGGLMTRAAKEGSAVAKAGSVLGKVSNATNPLTVATMAAKTPFRLIRGSQAAASGAGYENLARARQIATRGSKAERKAFKSQLYGKAPQSEIADTALEAMKAIEARNAQRFAQQKAGIFGANPQALDFSRIDEAIAQAEKAANPGGIASPSSYMGPTKAALDEAKRYVAHWKANPSLHTMEGFEALRTGIGDLLNPADSTLQKHLGGVYHAVRDTMKEVSPQYTDILESTTAARRNLNDLRRTLGLGPNTAQTMSVAKQLRAQRTGRGADLMKQLAEVRSELPAMLAGAALSPNAVGGVRGIVESLGYPMLSGVHLLSNPTHWPAIAAGAAYTAAASSPKLGGLTNYYIGGPLGGALDAVAGTPGRAAYLATRQPYQPNGLGAAQPTAVEQNSDGSWTSGDPEFDRLLKQESFGGHQFYPRDMNGHKKGELVRSGAGAIGAAQVMPKTAKFIAEKLLNEPLDENAYRNDAAYNIRLGLTYYRWLRKKYANPALAAAAYNTGPGNLDKALASSEKSGRVWTAELPYDETRKYVANTFPNEPVYTARRPARASGGRATPDKEQLVRQLMTKADQAKRAATMATKPLLQSDDSAVAHALEIAQRAI